MTFKATAVLVATLLASPIVVTQAGFADGKGKSSGKHSTGTSTVTTTVIQLKADLTPVLGVTGDGKATYSNKTGTKGTDEKFTGKVEFPVTDLALAEAAVFEMHLARNAAEYAVCSLTIKEIEFKYQPGTPPVPNGIEAEYRVSAKQKTPVGGVPTATELVGSCVPAVPAVQALDTVTVVQQGVGTTLLTGTFVSGNGEDDDD
jgi:hypothetical protein